LDLVALLFGAGKKLSVTESVALMEFRRVVVGGFGAELVLRAEDGDVAELDAIVAEERTQRGRPRRLAELDYRFNEVLARASGNLFYTLLMRSVRAIHVELGCVIFAEVGDDEVIIETHAAIVKALRTRSGPKLEKSLALYLEGGLAVIQAFAKKHKRKNR
jgi:DNA-binding FadR family transcriptional regulator